MKRGMVKERKVAKSMASLVAAIILNDLSFLTKKKTSPGTKVPLTTLSV
jgi:hypothetical protein